MHTVDSIVRELTRLTRRQQIFADFGGWGVKSVVQILFFVMDLVSESVAPVRLISGETCNSQ